VKFFAVLPRNDMSNDIGVWHDDRSMYLVVHTGLKCCNGPFWVYFEGPIYLEVYYIESYRDINQTGARTVYLIVRIIKVQVL
jgi:hypothetical protein